MKKILAGIALLIALGWAATLFFEAERLRTRVRQSLERALNRRVDVNGPIDYKWLTGPGFEVTDVVIHDDPRLGLEPIAYVSSLEATPIWSQLLRGRIAFSTLRLDEPSVNLMRTDSGEVNIQPFLAGLFSARDSGTELPEIKVRGGRLNFKQGLRKSVFYLTAMDLDLRPTESNGFNISLVTEAARTDRQPMGYGSFSGQGRLRLLTEREPELDFTLDLDRSALSDVLLLFEGRRVDLGGRISARTRIVGPLSKLEIDGRVDLEDFQRWNLPGFKPGALTLFYRGVANLQDQSIAMRTVSDSKSALPITIRLRADRAFSKPRWGMVAAAEEIPMAVIGDAARVTGYPIPEDLNGLSSAAGAIGVSSSQPDPRGGFLLRFEDGLKRTGTLWPPALDGRKREEIRRELRKH